MHRHAGALIIRRQEVSAAAVGGEKGRGVGRRDAAGAREPSGAGVEAMAGDLRDRAMSHVEAVPVGVYRQ
jgi:hypothetical protein